MSAFIVKLSAKDDLSDDELRILIIKYQLAVNTSTKTGNVSGFIKNELLIPFLKRIQKAIADGEKLETVPTYQYMVENGEI